MFNKKNILIAISIIVLALLVFLNISNYINNKPVKEGIDLVNEEEIDFKNNKNGFKEPSIILIGYAKEVEKMPKTRHRKAFIKNVDEINLDYKVTVREWNNANDDFRKIRDEYELEDKKY